MINTQKIHENIGVTVALLVVLLSIGALGKATPYTHQQYALDDDFTHRFLSAVWLRGFGRRKGSVVLVLGASGSGKTALFYQASSTHSKYSLNSAVKRRLTAQDAQLRDGSLHQGTVPSMQHNEDTVQLPTVEVSGQQASKPSHYKFLLWLFAVSWLSSTRHSTAGS